VKRTVPYFKDWKTFNEETENGKYKNMDEFLFHHLEALSSTDLDIVNRTFDDNEHVKALPDAVYRIKEANN